MPYINDAYIPEDRYMDLSGTEEPIWPYLSLWFRRGVYGLLFCVAAYSIWRGLVHPRKASSVACAAPTLKAASAAMVRQWIPVDWQFNYISNALDDQLEAQIAAAYWNSRLLGEKPACMKSLPDNASLVEGGYNYHTTLSNAFRGWNCKSSIYVDRIDPRIQNDISNKVLRFHCFAGERQAIIIGTSRPSVTNRTQRQAFVIGNGCNYCDGPKVYAAKRIATLILDDILRQQSNALCVSTNRNVHALHDTILGRYKVQH